MSTEMADTMQQAIDTLNIEKNMTIEAPIGIVWESILEEMGPASIGGDDKPMPMKVETWPGGRWYRDLGGEGGNGAGHLWGHIQVIKPPKLIEICGPLFMSYPCMNHVQYRLTDEGDSTHVKLTHRAVGLIDPQHAKGVNTGWQEVLEQVKSIATRRMKKM